MVGLLEFSQLDIWCICGAFILMLLDVIIGLLGSFIRHDFSSTVMREGLGHKVMVICVIVLAAIIQVLAVHITTIPSFPSLAVVCVYVIVMEVGSIWETVQATYPEIGDTPLKDAFDAFTDSDGGESK